MNLKNRSRSLVIISHTPHYLDENNDFVGYEPTVKEINFLSDIFDKIYHIAPLYNYKSKQGNLKYISNRIRFIPIKPTGGKKLLDKIKILLFIPYNLKIIKNIISKTDYIHFRAPTNIGIYLLPYLFFCNQVKWIKYAGNWKEKSPPLSFKLQRWFLKKNFLNTCVTINGKWPNQEKHLLSFENPCITDEEFMHCLENLNNKEFKETISICFVGELVKNKGAHLLLESLDFIKNNDCLDTVYIVGEGIEKENLKTIYNGNINIEFLGFLPKKELNEIYKKSHLFVLPSKTEGFPKVIAESLLFGCIPIVPDISSIGQYIGQEKGIGFLLQNNTAKSIAQIIDKYLDNRDSYIYKEQDYLNLCKKFTFKYYNKRIFNEFIKKNESI